VRAQPDRASRYVRFRTPLGYLACKGQLIRRCGPLGPNRSLKPNLMRAGTGRSKYFQDSIFKLSRRRRCADCSLTTHFKLSRMYENFVLPLIPPSSSNLRRGCTLLPAAYYPTQSTQHALLALSTSLAPPGLSLPFPPHSTSSSEFQSRPANDTTGKSQFSISDL
jgi:hypothetical protein